MAENNRKIPEKKLNPAAKDWETPSQYPDGRRIRDPLAKKPPRREIRTLIREACGESGEEIVDTMVAIMRGQVIVREERYLPSGERVEVAVRPSVREVADAARYLGEYLWGKPQVRVELSGEVAVRPALAVERYSTQELTQLIDLLERGEPDAVDGEIVPEKK